MGGGPKKDKNMVYQILTPGNPAEMDQAEEVVFKSGDKQAMKMNGMMLKMIRGQMEKNSMRGGGFVLTYSDITARKKAELGRRRSESATGTGFPS